MNINLSNLNFKAQLTKNPDLFGNSRPNKEIFSVYDEEINHSFLVRTFVPRIHYRNGTRTI